jgi:hypothetical protein
MKQIVSAILLACFSMAALSQSKSTLTASEQILRLLDEQMRAANAHDTNRFLATCVHESSLLFVVNGEMIYGWDNLQRQQLKWWNNGKSDVVYSQPAPPQFMVLDSRSVLVTQQLRSHRTLPNVKPSDGRFVVTSLWRHLAAGWRITYCHESWAT